MWLNERSSSPTSPAALTGSLVDRSPRAKRFAASATRLTGRAIERARKSPKAAIRSAEAIRPPTANQIAWLDRLRAAAAPAAARSFSTARKRANCLRSASTRRFPSPNATAVRAAGGFSRAISTSGTANSFRYSSIAATIARALRRWDTGPDDVSRSKARSRCGSS
jgi:hypothetical protein